MPDGGCTDSPCNKGGRRRGSLACMISQYRTASSHSVTKPARSAYRASAAKSLRTARRTDAEIAGTY